MINSVLTSVLLTISIFLQTDLRAVRSNFEKAESSKENTAILYKQLKDYSKNDPVLLAYKGAAYGLQARYMVDKKKKKELFIAGAKDIEAAVLASPDNIEIRLVRLIIQENTPKILKYKENITADKQMILTNFESQPKVVKDAIRRYATTRSKVFTAVDLQKIAN